VSRNYPEMRERLRHLLNKKKRSNKTGSVTAATRQQQTAAAKTGSVTAGKQHPPLQLSEEQRRGLQEATRLQNPHPQAFSYFLIFYALFS
jgi:hypothetical protein